MQDGFVKVAARTPEVRVADVDFNVKAVVQEVRESFSLDGARVIVLPELALTGYTCEDLFWQDALLDAAEKGVADVAQATSRVDALVLVGAPVRAGGKLYNCAVALSRGRVLGIVPKRHIPNYNEFYEARHFCAGPLDVTRIDFAGQRGVPFGARQLFACDGMANLVVAAEVCEDLWVPEPPSIAHALAGATVLCNLSASNAIVGKAAYRKSLVAGQSARLVAGYVYCSAGWGESTQDLVFSAHDIVAENGSVLAEGRPFREARATSEVDVDMLAAERRRCACGAALERIQCGRAGILTA